MAEAVVVKKDWWSAIGGYFRTYELEVPGPRGPETRGYHKPVMIAGGVGNVRDVHVQKGEVPDGAPLVVLGGPALLIGLGGGAASSMAQGASPDAQPDRTSAPQI